MTHGLSTRGAKTALAVSCALALSAVSGQAAADVYAGSRLLLQNLSIAITDGQGTPLNSATNFDFFNTNTATLEGAGEIANNNCAGVAGAAGTCFSGIDPAKPADADAANAPDGDVTRPNNNFGYYGPGADQYANSDSVIDEAQLINGTPTATRQIAEAELQTGQQASANAEISSQTNLTFTFTVPDDNATVDLAFEADVDLLAAVAASADPPVTTSAESGWKFTLDQAGTNDQVQWEPEGSAVNDCVVSGFAGVVCTENADGEDLNNAVNAGAGAFPQTNAYSRTPEANPGFSNFRLIITGLPAGDYQLKLDEFTSVTLTQGEPSDTPPPHPVPAGSPLTLAMLMLGLLVAGISRLRRFR